MCVCGCFTCVCVLHVCVFVSVCGCGMRTGLCVKEMWGFCYKLLLGSVCVCVCVRFF